MLVLTDDNHHQVSDGMSSEMKSYKMLAIHNVVYRHKINIPTHNCATLTEQLEAESESSSVI